jgi:hypothetical protein
MNRDIIMGTNMQSDARLGDPFLTDLAGHKDHAFLFFHLA